MTDRSEVLEQLNVHALIPSKTNPRGKLDKAGLEELTESVRSHGVLQAILVRRVPEKSRIDGIEYEIVAGHRRWRAALAAKLALIPAQIRNLSDEQVLELQLIENLQRQDIHPLDEAQGYKRLVAMGHSIDELAARVSKSASYIYQRLKLAELVPDAQAAFRENRISAAHAVQIARLQPGDQHHALNFCFDIFRGARPKEAEREPKEGEARHGVRELAEFIQREIHLELNRAPFPVADALLVEKAGACTTCPKRTGFNKGLFADIAEEDTCTDPGCYRSKVDAWVRVQFAAARPDSGPTPDLLSDGYNPRPIAVTDKGPAPTPLTPQRYALIGKKSEACPFARPALIADGENAGKLVSACTDPKCRTHFAKDGTRRYPSERVQGQDRKKQEANLKLARHVRGAILQRVLDAAPKKLGREELNLAAMSLVEGLPGNVLAMLNHRHGWKDPFSNPKEPSYFNRINRLSDVEFARFIVELVALPDTYVPPYEAQAKTIRLPFRLGLFAKRAKVNVARLETTARKEAKAKKKPRAAKLHTSAKRPRRAGRPKAINSQVGGKKFKVAGRKQKGGRSGKKQASKK